MAQRKKTIIVELKAERKRWSITISGSDKEAKAQIIEAAKALEASGKFQIVNGQRWLDLVECETAKENPDGQ